MAVKITATDDAKIQAGADAYLELFKHGRRKAEVFLRSLQEELCWTLPEIIALRGRVDILIKDRRK